jgi:hypothetical protein
MMMTSEVAMNSHQETSTSMAVSFQVAPTISLPLRRVLLPAAIAAACNTSALSIESGCAEAASEAETHQPPKKPRRPHAHT